MSDPDRFAATSGDVTLSETRRAKSSAVDHKPPQQQQQQRILSVGAGRRRIDRLGEESLPVVSRQSDISHFNDPWHTPIRSVIKAYTLAIGQCRRMTTSQNTIVICQY